MDEECRRSIQESKTLAGIFQSIVQDCKVWQIGYFRALFRIVGYGIRIFFIILFICIFYTFNKHFKQLI